MAHQIDPIWKFCELLNRLTRNDKRIIDCLTSLARDYPAFAHIFIDHFTQMFMAVQEPYRKLLFLYVADSLSYNLVNMREYLSQTIAVMFDSAYRIADANVKNDLERLLEVWERQERFRRNVIDEIRERMQPLPPRVSSPIQLEDGSGIFDLHDINDWLNHQSSMPLELLAQASQEEADSIFQKLLAHERSKIEYERMSYKLAVVQNQQELYRKLLYELYDELSRQCLNCGLRFSLDSELDAHLDWHFKINNRKEPTEPWLPKASQWVDPKLSLGLVEETNQMEKTEETIYWAPCDPDQLQCLICGQEFDISPAEAGWVCRDSVKTFIEDEAREVVLHMSCIKSINDNIEITTEVN